MKPKKRVRRTIQFCGIALFLGCFAFLLYYLVLQPHYSRKVNEKYRKIYYESENLTESPSRSSSKKETKEERQIRLDRNQKKNAKDEMGILLKFKKLISYNEDIRGWLKIPGTKIDYPVMQDYHGEDFYLEHDFEGHKDKNGCLYLDGHSSIETPSTNLVIHGHNMETTHMMFYELPKYKNLDFYQKHPVITFDTLYENSQWKIISFMRVSGTMKDNGTFNYLTGVFYQKEDYLNFLYEIESRSLYHCPVDVNEKDRLLMLSTCSYEFDNCRTVVVARRLRKGESSKVDTTKAFLKKDTFYPNAWYKQYGGTPPAHTNFYDALAFNEIDWYDGKKESPSPIGSQYTLADGSTYELTSLNTVKFLGCEKNDLKQLTLPKQICVAGRNFNVTEIDSSAFKKLKDLEKIKWEANIDTIPANAFRHCKKLSSVVLGDEVTSIGTMAFFNIETLKKVEIRSLKLQAIGDRAFAKSSEKIRFLLPHTKLKKYKKLLEQSKVQEKARFKVLSS